jgi:hypothetical protein
VLHDLDKHLDRLLDQLDVQYATYVPVARVATRELRGGYRHAMQMCKSVDYLAIAFKTNHTSNDRLPRILVGPRRLTGRP